MTTLKAPSMSNLLKREKFLLDNPEYPNCVSHLDKIKAIRAYQESKLRIKKVKKSQEDYVDGAEFYKQLKANEVKQKPNFIKRFFKSFVRGDK